MAGGGTAVPTVVNFTLVSRSCTVSHLDTASAHWAAYFCAAAWAPRSERHSMCTGPLAFSKIRFAACCI